MRDVQEFLDTIENYLYNSNLEIDEQWCTRKGLQRQIDQNSDGGQILMKLQKDPNHHPIGFEFKSVVYKDGKIWE
jgi:hypothetical protein